MRKFGLFALTVLSIGLFSCGNKSEADLNAQIDSLQTALNNRDADYRQLDEFLTVISTGLDSIAMQESEIFNRGKESPMPSHETIKSELATFKQTLQNQRERIAQLEKKLAGSEGNAKKLQRIIISLKAQLTERESQIATLEDELNHKNVTIEELGVRMGALTKQTTEQQEVIASQDKMLQSQDEMLNEGYIKIATKKDLKGLDILKKGKVMISNLDRKQFKTIDIRVVTELTINAKKPKVLTQMPEDSYTIERNGNTSVLRIIDTNKFWSVSKYLIIQTD